MTPVDIDLLRGLSTILVMIAFLGVCWWAFAPSRKKRFEEAAHLPFVEDADTSPEKETGANASSVHTETSEQRQDQP